VWAAVTPSSVGVSAWRVSWTAAASTLAAWGAGPSGGTPAGSCDHDLRRPDVDDPASGCRTTRSGHARLALAPGSVAVDAQRLRPPLVAARWPPRGAPSRWWPPRGLATTLIGGRPAPRPPAATRRWPPLVAAAPPAVSTVASHGQRQVAIGGRGGHRWPGWPRAARPGWPDGHPVQPPCTPHTAQHAGRPMATTANGVATVSGWLACTPPRPDPTSPRPRLSPATITVASDNGDVGHAR